MRIVEPDEETGARRPAGFEEALVGQISAAALLIDHWHARPEEEGADLLVALRGRGEARIVEIERHDLGVEPRGVEPIDRIVGTGAADAVAAPDHLALPEG